MCDAYRFWNNVAHTLKYPSQFSNEHVPESVRMVAQAVLDVRKLAGGPALFELKPDEPLEKDGVRLRPVAAALLGKARNGSELDNEMKEEE